MRSPFHSARAHSRSPKDSRCWEEPPPKAVATVPAALVTRPPPARPGSDLRLVHDALADSFGEGPLTLSEGFALLGRATAEGGGDSPSRASNRLLLALPAADRGDHV